jgi:hypothetical protein
MRRVITIVLAVVILLGLFPGGVAIPQEATPGTDEMGPPESFELAPGVMADNVVFVEGSESPVLYRLHFEPGVVYPVEPGVNLELVHVEAGSLTLTLDAPITVGQLGQNGSVGETVSAGTEVTLSTGQFFVLQPGIGGEVRNNGSETATVSIAGVVVQGTAIPAATPAG